jgi:hypothetical protein
MVTVETVSIVFTGLSISLAALYYVMTLRNTNITRQAQLFMQLYNRWDSSEFVKFWFDFQDKEISDYESDKEYAVAFRALARFIEGIGVLVKRNLIDITLVDDLMSANIIDFWETAGPAIRELRVQTNKPQYGEWAEYLYKRIKPIVEQQHPELKT